jgi:hypothetical protein
MFQRPGPINVRPKNNLLRARANVTLEDLDCQVSANEPAGIVGADVARKSTLLIIPAGPGRLRLRHHHRHEGCEHPDLQHVAYDTSAESEEREAARFISLITSDLGRPMSLAVSGYLSRFGGDDQR